jgi:hypothetical protein
MIFVYLFFFLKDNKNHLKKKTIIKMTLPYNDQSPQLNDKINDVMEEHR